MSQSIPGEILSELVDLDFELFGLRGTSSGTPGVIGMEEGGAFPDGVDVVADAPLVAEVAPATGASGDGAPRRVVGRLSAAPSNLFRVFESVPHGAVVEERLLEVDGTFAHEGVLVVRDQVPKSHLQDAIHELFAGDSREGQVRVPDRVLACWSDFGLYAVGIRPKSIKRVRYLFFFIYFFLT